MANKTQGDKKKAPARKKTPAKAAASKTTAGRQKSQTTSSPKPRKQARKSTSTAEKATVRTPGQKQNTASAENKEKLIDRLWHLVALIAFALIAHMTLLVLLFPLALLQIIVILIDDKPNSEVQNLLNIIKTYIVQCLDFVIFRSEQMPFPFQPLPKPAKD